MAAYCSPFAILVHSHLGLEWGATAAGRFYHEEDDEGGGERQRHFNPRQANIIVCDEDPTVSLVEEVKLCEENGWEALLLAAKELTRLFPELWSTRKAAEDWSRKNPLNPCISIIRLWGVLNTYRPPGQTSWSKALVRHGADPRVALAAVLGVGAGHIRVRDRPE